MSQSTITVHLMPADGTDAIPLKASCGQSLMKAATRAHIDAIAADCGGSLTCATCHVVVADEHAQRLPPPDETEQGMLDFTAVPRSPNSRLSCQIMLTPALDGLVVHLPITQY